VEESMTKSFKNFITEESHKPKFNKNTEVFHGEKPEGVKRLSGGYHADRKVSWLETLESHKQKSGAGSAGLHHFEKWSKEKGATHVHAEALPTSLGFWEKKGYKKVGKPTSKNRVPIKKEL
jgi:hypothetical protein